MSDIHFYHLKRQPLNVVLPVLLQKTREKGWKAVVECADHERLKAIDDHLWMFSEDDFLPHAVAQDADPERDTIVLTTSPENPIAAHVRFLTDGVDLPDDLDTYERVIVLFDGNDADALARARLQWKNAPKDNHSLTYWQQDEAGRWSQKA
jgi:DNA polymerase III subunit chi